MNAIIAPQTQRTSGMAVASMVLGIVSLIGGFALIVPSILAIIFGHISLSCCRKNYLLGGKGMAITGLITGYLSVFIAAVLIVAMAVPAFNKVRESSYEKEIRNNARQLASAADQFYLDRGISFAARSDLIGPDKYITILSPVAGESYPYFFEQGKPIIITLKDGREIVYETK